MSGINYSGTSTFNNIDVNGTATAATLEVEGQLRDGDGNFGSAAQVLSSDGTDTKWITTNNTTYTYDSVASGNDVNLRLIGSCLLYTSPSPRDATLSRMQSSA